MNNDSNSSKKDNKTARIILIIIAVLMIVLGSISFGYYLYTKYVPTAQVETTTAADEQDKAEGKIDNPIDFDALKKGNDEIYAWIKVPGTEVDYPICQSGVDDSFYLKHRAEDRQWLSSGAIYTESWNTKTFRDRVTVIYGHNGYRNASMFTTLHKFEKSEFFNKHDKFYIYTPDSKLTYQIISAFKYDDRHIMGSFDFQNNAVFDEFIKMIENPDSTNKNVRSALDKELTLDDNIVVLSTCITNQKSNRYLVCGVLIKDEKTN